jgi:hypothetical protein
MLHPHNRTEDAQELRNLKQQEEEEEEEAVTIYSFSLISCYVFVYENVSYAVSVIPFLIVSVCEGSSASLQYPKYINIYFGLVNMDII